MTDCPTLSYTSTCQIRTLSLQCRIQTEDKRGEGRRGAVIQILRKGEKGGTRSTKNFFSALWTLVWSKNGGGGGGGGGAGLTRPSPPQFPSFPGLLDCWHNIATTLYELKSTRPSSSCTGTWKTLTLRKLW